MAADPDEEAEVHAVLRALLDAVMLVDVSRLKPAQATGLTLPQLRALRRLHERPHTQGELAELIDLSPAGASRIVDRLRDRGLVAARRTEQDRRVVEVRLTEAGFLALDDVSPLRHTVIERAVERMPPQRRARITRALRDLLAAADADERTTGS